MSIVDFRLSQYERSSRYDGVHMVLVLSVVGIFFFVYIDYSVSFFGNCVEMRCTEVNS